jgi:tetratricopeptide (TPR) repeat protein
MTAATDLDAGVAALLRDAIAFHRGGQLAQAEATYLEILLQVPAHAEALHLLGLLEAQRRNFESAIALITRSLEVNEGNAAAHLDLGFALHATKRPVEALERYGRALALRPDYAKAFFNRGITLRELNRLPEALESFERAVALNPDGAEAMECRGSVLCDLGRLEEALLSYQRALAIRPDFAQALNGRGNVLRRMQRPADALESYDAALARVPDYPEALSNRGNALLELGRPEEALESFERALALDPDRPEILNNRGNALASLKRLAEAVADFERAAAVEPDFAEVHNNLANALLGLRRPEEALACAERALVLRPDYADALINRGNALRALMRLEEALASYDRALALQPDSPKVLSNRGTALMELGQLEEARVCFERALSFDPEHAGAHWNGALLSLLTGDFTTGFSEYEWRWKEQFAELKRNFPQALWLGSGDLRGKTILLHAEQGLGDAIQFCRYAPHVAARGATVLLEVQPEIRDLAVHLHGVSRVLVRGEPLPEFDFHCPLLSLPLAFRTTPETIPGEVPYLHIPPEHVQRWRERLAALPELRIGIGWQGNVNHYRDGYRSFPLSRFAEVARLPGISLISLQKGHGAEQLGDPRNDFSVVDMTRDLVTFLDTGAIMKNLDLVITADTAVAHLAGALGVPVWVALPYAPDWRWMLERDDSPWYPTMRLFRQRSPGDWNGVFAEICRALPRFAVGDRGR